MDDEGSWEPFLLEGTSNFPFLPEMFGVSVQSTEMLLLGFETFNYADYYFVTFPSIGSCVPKNQCHNFSLFTMMIFFFFPAELMLHCCISQLLFVGFCEAVCEVSTSL